MDDTNVKLLLTAENPVKMFERLIQMESIDDEVLYLFDAMYYTEFSKNTISYEEGCFRIVSPDDYNRTIVLDKGMFADKKKLLRNDTIANFDSNIISMLPKYFEGKINSPDFEKLLLYIKQRGINISSSPYCFEDSLNINGMKNKSKVYETLLSYAQYSRLTYEELLEKNYKIDISDYIKADSIYNEMLNLRDFCREQEKQAKSIFCFLLEVYIIQFKGGSYTKKLDELISFINSELGIFFEAGIILAAQFFKREDNDINKFFQKVQPKSKDKLKDIEGMAWDLFHYWNIPNEMVTDYYSRGVVSSIYLVTHDDAFAKVIRKNLIKRILITEKNKAYVKCTKEVDDYLSSSQRERIAAETDERARIYSKLDIIKLSNDLGDKLLNM